MMFNEAQVSLTGYVATQPRWRGRGSPSQNLMMRVAWTTRRIDKSTGEWADGHTSYVSVYCWRKVAENVATCVRKGDPVVVKGRLTVRDYTDKNGVQRTNVEVDASALGHDLSRGVAQFQRTRPATGMTADEYAETAASGEYAGAGEYAIAEHNGAAHGSAVDGSAVDGSAANGDGAGSAGAEADERPGDEIFNEEAISALAAQADEVPVPF
jgi:single-strand DNA-binding protein